MRRIDTAAPSDLDLLYALNQSESPQVGSVSRERFGWLVKNAALLRVARSGEGLAGFILAFDEQSSYDSMNFQWFKSRYPRFLYVDRIAITPDERGKGWGRLLYQDVESRAGSAPIITCEVNIKPPNPGSMAFHAKLGFTKVGEQDTENNSKRVAMLLKRLE